MFSFKFLFDSMNTLSVLSFPPIATHVSIDKHNQFSTVLFFTENDEEIKINVFALPNKHDTWQPQLIKNITFGNTQSVPTVQPFMATMGKGALFH